MRAALTGGLKEVPYEVVNEYDKEGLKPEVGKEILKNDA
ncbi:hypothetical protein KN1_13140 [Stygiolobus caldivivus]|uniref:Uncharacterized protein n=1 Tax=Stygiolobus caldivivus TaxID=2824673 RepID=A0A8D5U687_9CREN|nr:hypothetical protein KN1_13140 [Stygiolobus caldivivus]